MRDIADGLSEQLKKSRSYFVCYSLATDESTGIQDITPLLVFIYGVDENLKVTKELAELCSMQGQDTGEGISKEVKEAIEKLKLP